MRTVHYLYDHLSVAYVDAWDEHMICHACGTKEQLSLYGNHVDQARRFIYIHKNCSN